MPESHYYHHYHHQQGSGSGDGGDRRGRKDDPSKKSKMDLFRPEKRENREMAEIRARQEALSDWFSERYADLDKKYNEETKKLDDFVSRTPERAIERTEIAAGQRARLDETYAALRGTLSAAGTAFEGDMAAYGHWAQNSTRFEYFTGLNRKPLKEALKRWEERRTKMQSAQTKDWSEITEALRDERRPERDRAVDLSIDELRPKITALKEWADRYAEIEQGKIDLWVTRGSGRESAAEEIREIITDLYAKYNVSGEFEDKLTKLNNKHYTSDERRMQKDLSAYETLVDRYTTDVEGRYAIREAEWTSLEAELAGHRQSFEDYQRQQAEAEARRQYQQQYGYQQDDFGYRYAEEDDDDGPHFDYAGDNY